MDTLARLEALEQRLAANQQQMDRGFAAILKLLEKHDHLIPLQKAMIDIAKDRAELDTEAALQATGKLLRGLIALQIERGSFDRSDLDRIRSDLMARLGIETGRKANPQSRSLQMLLAGMYLEGDD